MVAAVRIDSETARIRAALVNAGQCSFDEADAKLAAATLLIDVGVEAAETPVGQAAFLTASATGARCFGSVMVIGAVDTPLRVPLPLRARTLGEAAVILGARCTGEQSAGRRISIGSGSAGRCPWEVQAYWSGWIAGVAPASQRPSLGRSDCVLAGIAAGALAVGQAFLAEQGNLRAGKANQCISLWSPDVPCADGLAPAMRDLSLPRALWLIGLGNLGQAYLWSLFMLPYARPKDVMLFLQDDDVITPENWGTSLLVKRGRYGVLKTRLAEEWSLRRRFEVRRIDRRLDRFLRRGEREPGIALAGLDRMAPRRLLGLPGFEHIIDCGLGATVDSYANFRINAFDTTRDPAAHFKGVEDRTTETIKQLLELPAYKELSRSLNDAGCGAATLAGKSVAVPFVSTFAGTLAVAQAIRIASGEPAYDGITGVVGDVRTVRGVQGSRPERVVVETTNVACARGKE